MATDIPRHLRESFAEKIKRDVVVLPGGWTADGEDMKPNEAAFAGRLEAAFTDAKERWSRGPEAALERLVTLYETLSLQPNFLNMTPLVYYVSAFMNEAGYDLDEPGFARWKGLIDSGLLDFCERVVSSDDVLSQIYQVKP